jgi:hypothetical protein
VQRGDPKVERKYAPNSSEESKKSQSYSYYPECVYHSRHLYLLLNDLINKENENREHGYPRSVLPITLWNKTYAKKKTELHDRISSPAHAIAVNLPHNCPVF